MKLKRLNFEVWFPQNLITQTCASKTCASKLAFPYEVLGVLGERETERMREAEGVRGNLTERKGRKYTY